RSKKVVPGGRLAGRQQVEGVRVGYGDPGGDDRDHDHGSDHQETESRFCVREQERYPARQVEAAARCPRRRLEREVEGADRRMELGHQDVRRRGSRTRLSTSMIRFATITQIESTTSNACASA